MMVAVEILGCVVTAQYGTLKAGDILRTSAEFAANLVNDCQAAKFCEPPKPAADDKPPEAPKKRKP